MPVHDWTRISDGTFHDFHYSWVLEIKRVLAHGLLPNDRPMTAVSYTGGAVVEAFVDHFAVGEPTPAMPLFLTRANYVRVPLEAAYMAAWQDVPRKYQDRLLAS